MLDDGGLPREDHALLGEHIPGATLLDLPEFRGAACLTGGAGECLLALSILVRDYQVIQFDSDTLTVGPISEVHDCVRAPTVFAPGTWDKQQCESMREQWETASVVHPASGSHVQLLAKANLDKL